jgi:hypothetical protein
VPNIYNNQAAPLGIGQHRFGLSRTPSRRPFQVLEQPGQKAGRTLSGSDALIRLETRYPRVLLLLYPAAVSLPYATDQQSQQAEFNVALFADQATLNGFDCERRGRGIP